MRRPPTLPDNIRWRLALLGGAGAIMTALSFLTRNASPWWSGAWLNFGSGLIASAIVITLYDELRARELEAERLRRVRRVARSLTIVVRQHYRLLLDCYRSAATESSPPHYTTTTEFLGVARFRETIRHLDIYGSSPMNSDGKTPYFVYIETSCKQLHGALQATLANHALDLPDELASAIEAVVSSPMLMMGQILGFLCQFQPPGFPARMVQFDGLADQVADHALRFCRLLNALDNVESTGLLTYRTEDWHNVIFPIGHARRQFATSVPTPPP